MFDTEFSAELNAENQLVWSDGEATVREVGFVQRVLADVLNADQSASSQKVIQMRLQEALRARACCRGSEVTVEIRPANFSFHDRNAKVIKAEIEHGGTEYYLAMKYPEDLMLEEGPPLAGK
jgi:hypothetical protein